MLARCRVGKGMYAWGKGIELESSYRLLDVLVIGLESGSTVIAGSKA